MSEHEHGTMDISSQEKVFEGFIKWCVGVGIAAICALIFMAVFNS